LGGCLDYPNKKYNKKRSTSMMAWCFISAASADGARFVYAEDINGDGAADILVASMNDKKVRLFLI